MLSTQLLEVSYVLVPTCKCECFWSIGEILAKCCLWLYRWAMGNTGLSRNQTLLGWVRDHYFNYRAKNNHSNSSNNKTVHHNTYIYDRLTRLMHVGDDAVRQNQKYEVISAWLASVWRNSVQINITQSTVNNVQSRVGFNVPPNTL